MIDLLLDWRGSHADTVFLRGNHEQMALDARKEVLQYGDAALLYSEEFQRWWLNGGDKTASSYHGSRNTWPRAVPSEHWDFMSTTRMEHIVGGYHFVHAGLLPEGMTWEYADEGLDPRLWIREEFLDSESDFGGRVVVFGHTPQTTGRPLVMRNKIGLDTAAVFGLKLTVAAFDADARGAGRLNFDMRQF